jgi:flavin reductase (DIM6/NTAB) family NADH-FMN oxidoreductase RutF
LSSALSGNLRGIDADTYRQTCAQFATGVAVATVRATDGAPHGLTISSFTAVSISPPLILICIDFAGQALDHFRRGPYFAVSVLTDSQRELAVTFAEKPEGRFEGVAWRPGETGAPLLEGALSTIECRVEQVLDVGDHAVVFGEVVRAECHDGRPLLYFNREYRALG